MENALEGVSDFVGDLLGAGASATKPDLARSKWIADKVGLNKEQRELFHRFMRREKSSAADMLSDEELFDLAEEVKQMHPKGNR